MTPEKIKNSVYLLPIITVGLVLRIYNLGKYGFWFDESLPLIIASHLNKFYIQTNLPGHFPLTFTILLKGWMSIASGDYFLRLFSVIFGIFSIIMVYVMGKFIFSKKIGILAALLLSVSPLHIYYSQELTGYSLSVFLALCSSYYFLRVLKNPSPTTRLLYMVASSAFIYNHSINIILVLIQNIFFFLFYSRNKGLKKKWLYLQMVILVISLPCLAIAGGRLFIFSRSDIYSWIPRPGLLAPINTFMIFSLGYQAYWISQMIVAVIFISLLIRAVFHWRKNSDPLYFVMWLIIPVFTIWLISQLHPFYLHRLFIFSLPAFYLLAAAGTEKMNKLLLWGAISIYFILAGCSLKNYYGNKWEYNYQNDFISAVWPKKDYRSAALYVAEKFSEGDIILHICDSSFVPFLYYHKDKFPEFGVKIGDIYKNNWRNITLKGLARNSVLRSFEIKSKGGLDDYKRVWLIDSSWQFSGTIRYDQLNRKIINWFENNLFMKEMQLFEGMNIYLFTSARDKNAEF